MNPLQKTLIGGALVLTTLGGGALGANLVSGIAGASTPASSTNKAADVDNDGDHGRDGDHGGPHQANGITEKELTGADLATAKAAALKALPGATIERVE